MAEGQGQGQSPKGPQGPHYPPKKFIKKCKSATFALDGMLYTISKYTLMFFTSHLIIVWVNICSHPVTSVTVAIGGMVCDPYL
ncbi:hypothetical protein BaRGS_00014350 [Batillaria attramentaria]|uniref:Uncharacterized protein n=1 Tax=Batillaria attramentaria TaxID=370345 RepID=A0ABD0L5C3_9CAEN